MTMQIQAEKRNGEGMFRSLLSPFAGSRAFPLLWFGQTISVLGSAITNVILPMVVYSLTGSATSMGYAMAMYMLPIVLILPFSGWVVDRYDRVRLMMASDIIRFLVMLAIASLLLTDRLSMGALFGLVAVYGLMDGLFHPAYAAVRAVVFTPQIRNAANALTQVSSQTVRLIGPALGGLLVAVVSAGVGYGIDAVTFLVSFICLWALRSALPKAPPSPGGRAIEFKKDWTEGISVLKSHPWLWITILAFSVLNICFNGLLAVIIPWLFKIHFQMNSFYFGIGMTCSGGGAILAALLFGSRPHWRRRGLIAYGGAFLSGVAFLLMPFTPWVPVLAALMALEGFGLMIFSLVWETSLQELVPQEAFGRVVSLDMMGSFMLLPVGYVLIGWMADWIGGIWTMALFASLGILIVASILAVPSIRRFD